MKILLLEDDQLLNDAIAKFLTIKGHQIEVFRDGTSAYDAIKSSSYDLLVLDINVPNINGLKLLESLHEEKIQIHTIFISANIEMESISDAFNLGCNDYIKKPFHLNELAIRIEKIFKSTNIPNSHLRLSKSYSLDMELSILRFNGEVQVVSPRQLKILTLLANNRSRTVDYTLFQEYAWDSYEIEIPTIRAEINRLKKTLKEDIIINVRNMGYMIKKPD